MVHFLGDFHTRPQGRAAWHRSGAQGPTLRWIRRRAWGPASPGRGRQRSGPGSLRCAPGSDCGRDGRRWPGAAASPSPRPERPEQPGGCCRRAAVRRGRVARCSPRWRAPGGGRRRRLPLPSPPAARRKLIRPRLARRPSHGDLREIPAVPGPGSAPGRLRSTRGGGAPALPPQSARPWRGAGALTAVPAPRPRAGGAAAPRLQPPAGDGAAGAPGAPPAATPRGGPGPAEGGGRRGVSPSQFSRCWPGSASFPSPASGDCARRSGERRAGRRGSPRRPAEPGGRPPSSAPARPVPAALPHAPATLSLPQPEHGHHGNVHPLHRRVPALRGAWQVRSLLCAPRRAPPPAPAPGPTGAARSTVPATRLSREPEED